MRGRFVAVAIGAALAWGSPARAHERPSVALRVDVTERGDVFVHHLAGPYVLLALELPAGCHVAGHLGERRLETSRDLPAHVQCTAEGLRAPWHVSGLGSQAQALALRVEGAAVGTWTVLPGTPTFTLATTAGETPGRGPGSATDAPPFDPRPAIVAGASHVAHGLDHLALVALLVVRAARLRDALVPLLGFTVAHALTLGLAAFGHPLMPARLAELLVAVSLVLATRLRRSEPLLPRAGAAFTFGLVHGVAFLEGAAPLLAHGHAPLATLAAFHVGIELVQVTVALGLAVAFAAAEARETFALRLRIAVATLAGAYGVALVLARLA